MKYIAIYGNLHCDVEIDKGIFLNQRTLSHNITRVTPMMQQYLSIKAAYENYLLFYRMGDFYELFFDDAVTAAKELEIVLTKRGMHEEQDIPMCGVPAHSSDHYLYKLVQKGYHIAICEQLESPEEAKKRGAKSVVRREVVRIVTPGTVTEEKLLEAKELNYLSAVHISGGFASIAWVDISIGDFFVATIPEDILSDELSRLSPKEIIISERFLKDEVLKEKLSPYLKFISQRTHNVFDLNRSTARLKTFFSISSLSVLGNISEGGIIASGALLEYLEHTQKASLPHLNKPKIVQISHFMSIDLATRRNLELDNTINGKKNSLRTLLDYTITASGGRLLSLYVALPLLDPIAINNRLDCIECFKANHTLLNKLREYLSSFPDVERSLSRIATYKASVFDLLAIRDGIKTATLIAELMRFSQVPFPSRLESSLRQICMFDSLLTDLRAIISIDAQNTKSGFVRSGYSPQLDNFYNLKENAAEAINKLKEKYQSITGITNLKISKNNIIGYFIEVSSANALKMTDEPFIHRQSLGNMSRYTTYELKELENNIISCASRISDLENQIFLEACNAVINSSEQISLAAKNIAFIDVIASMAVLANKMNYVRPFITNTREFDIVNGRHPVIEKSLGSKFISNNCNLGEENNLWLITGPNMAGKSTFLRQSALICIMAQIGSFVPADSLRLGVVDKLFSRIGAGDNITHGQSTFMVEMLETAYIINNATDRSLIILDEIGRGTSTYDGLSIAWSVIEHIHNMIGARTMFATHYHELTILEDSLKRLKCYTMKVNEWDGKVIFLHQVIQGKADKSYGIHVAQMAGIPATVVDRANQILSKLSSKEVL